MHTMVVAIDFHTTEVLPLTKVIIPITIVEETPTLVTPAIREAMIWERSQASTTHLHFPIPLFGAQSQFLVDNSKDVGFLNQTGDVYTTTSKYSTKILESNDDQLTVWFNQWTNFSSPWDKVIIRPSHFSFKCQKRREKISLSIPTTQSSPIGKCSFIELLKTQITEYKALRDSKLHSHLTYISSNDKSWSIDSPNLTPQAEQAPLQVGEWLPPPTEQYRYLPLVASSSWQGKLFEQSPRTLQASTTRIGNYQ